MQPAAIAIDLYASMIYDTGWGQQVVPRSQTAFFFCMGASGYARLVSKVTNLVWVFG